MICNVIVKNLFYFSEYLKITFSFRFIHFTVRICAEFSGRQPYSITSDENTLIDEQKNIDFCLVYHSTVVPDSPVLMLLRAVNVLPVCFLSSGEEGKFA